MGRVMAIDFGTKRIGVAVTDELKMIASPQGTYNQLEFFPFLANYIAAETVECIVVGKPVQMNNTDSESEKYILPFVKKLISLYPGIPVVRYDERFTSKMAQQAMIDGGLKKKDRQNKALLDSISAAIILQSYLENQNYKTS
ncbi:MAG: Holliday junction resolvase RuvX [Bacteroidota bacterium]